MIRNSSREFSTPHAVHLAPTTVAVAGLIVLAAFIVNAGLAIKFNSLKAFDQYNVFFDTDPNTRRLCFAHGKGKEGRSIVHPNLCNLVNPPIRVMAKVINATGIDISEKVTREYLSLLVAPVAAALQLVILFSTLALLGAPPLLSLPILTLAAFSFTNLIFGSVPDHFAIGGLSVSLILFNTALTLKRKDRNSLLWVASGFIAGSITVTNFSVFMLALSLSYIAVFGLKPAVSRAVVIGLSSVILLITYKIAMDAVYEGTTRAIEETASWTERYFRDDPLVNLAAFPIAVEKAIVASRPTTLPARLTRESDRYDFQFTLNDRKIPAFPGVILHLVLIATMISGAVIGLRSKRQNIFRVLYLVSAAIVGLNGAMHSIWGNEFFLYSQHWLAASIILILPVLLWTAEKPTTRNLVPILTVAFVCAAVFVNFREIEEILAVLNGVKAGS